MRLVSIVCCCAGAFLLWGISEELPAQNLLANSKFDQNIAGWNAGSNNGTVMFQPPPDGNGTVSGSLTLTSQNFAAGAAHGYAFQCQLVSLPENWPIRVSADVRRISGASVNHVLGIRSTPGCLSAQSVTNYVLFAEQGSGASIWKKNIGSLRARAGAKAVEAGLSVTCATGPCSAGLDNVLVEPALFWNSFE